MIQFGYSPSSDEGLCVSLTFISRLPWSTDKVEVKRLNQLLFVLMSVFKRDVSVCYNCLSLSRAHQGGLLSHYRPTEGKVQAAL